MSSAGRGGGSGGGKVGPARAPSRGQSEWAGAGGVVGMGVLTGGPPDCSAPQDRMPRARDPRARAVRLRGHLTVSSGDAARISLAAHVSIAWRGPGREREPSSTQPPCSVLTNSTSSPARSGHAPSPSSSQSASLTSTRMPGRRAPSSRTKRPRRAGAAAARNVAVRWATSVAIVGAEPGAVEVSGRETACVRWAWKRDSRPPLRAPWRRGRMGQLG